MAERLGISAYSGLGVGVYSAPEDVESRESAVGRKASEDAGGNEDSEPDEHATAITKSNDNNPKMGFILILV